MVLCGAILVAQAGRHSLVRAPHIRKKSAMKKQGTHAPFAKFPFSITIPYSVLMCLFCWTSVYSFDLGIEDCRKTVNLTRVNNSNIYVSNETSNGTAVCFECDNSHSLLATEVIFRINGEIVTSSSTMARSVTNKTHLIDTLVVSDSESVFNASSVTNIQCCEIKGLCSGTSFMVQVGVFLYYVFNPPRITGETVITECGRLNLSCDRSNSAPQPTLQWISPDGEVVSESGELEIENIVTSMAGIYACVATLPHSNTTMNNTVNVTIFPRGSNATYQCRDGPTDVQCTSHGVWDPMLDCNQNETAASEENAESLLERYKMWLLWGAGGVALILLCCITNCVVIIAVCVCKRKKKERKQYLLRENSDHNGQHRMTVQNYQYQNVVQSTSEGSTVLDGRYFMIETQEAMPEPNGQPLEPQTPPPPVLSTQYSMIQTVPEPTPEPESYRPFSESQSRSEQVPGPEPQYFVTQQAEPQYSVAQDEPQYSVAQQAEPQYAEAQQPVPQYSVAQAIPQGTSQRSGQYSVVQENTTGLTGEYCVVQTVEDNPTPDPSRPTPHEPQPVNQGQKQKGLVYVEVGLNTNGGGGGGLLRAPAPVAERVEYASLDLTAMANKPPPPPPSEAAATSDLDSKVCLDQILIQLKEVAPHWRRLGEAVGVGRLDEISQYVGSESDAMVEVVDGWLAQLHPNKPTWREIADVVDSIGHHDLALSLRQVYVSGTLPIEVSNAVPDTLMFQTEPPPLIPSRDPTTDHGNTSEETPPPIPPRS